jgi:hypothetical protein
VSADPTVNSIILTAATASLPPDSLFEDLNEKRAD